MKAILTFVKQYKPEIVPLYVAMLRAKKLKMDYKLAGRRFGYFRKGTVYLSPSMYMLLNSATREAEKDKNKELDQLMMKMEVITDASFHYPQIDR